MKKTKEVKKTRGLWLNIWLTFILIANLFVGVTYLLFAEVIIISYPMIPLGIAYLFGILALANFIFVLFLFKWKKWPFFAFCGTTIIGFILNLYTGLNILDSAMGLISPIILYLSMKSRWRLFS